MSQSLYAYLKPFTKDYIESNKLEWELYSNAFGPVKEISIQQLEALIGCRLPSQLLQFYREVGSGWLSYAINSTRKEPPAYPNEILKPQDICDLMKKGGFWIWEQHCETKEITKYWSDRRDPYDEWADRLKLKQVPVMDTSGQGDGFKVMYPMSDKPNAVYDSLGDILIEENFSDFIYNLYHISPRYYMDRDPVVHPKRYYQGT